MSVESPKFNTVESPKNDLEFLERGEVESIDHLEGYAPIMVIKIKDDGRALFKPADIEYPDFEDKGVFRGELEFLAFSIDKILGFNLVPPSAKRKLIEHEGILQRFIPKTEAVVAASLDFWAHYVDDLEIKKAAIFDYLTEAKDRYPANFLVDKERRKIWLIDHDYYMFMDTNPVPGTYGVTVILDRARRLADQDLPEELVNAVSGLIDKIDQINDSIQWEQRPSEERGSTEASRPNVIKLWLTGIKKRAEALVKEKRIPIKVSQT